LIHGGQVLPHALDCNAREIHDRVDDISELNFSNRHVRSQAQIGDCGIDVIGVFQNGRFDQEAIVHVPAVSDMINTVARISLHQILPNIGHNHQEMLRTSQNVSQTGCARSTFDRRRRADPESRCRRRKDESAAFGGVRRRSAAFGGVRRRSAAFGGACGLVLSQTILIT